MSASAILPCIWFFLLGTAMGSFYDLLIDRLPEGKDVIFVRSACGDCGTRLRWNDLIPVVSFLRLRGKCRYCGAKLSAWYLMSELLVGALFSFAFFRYSRTADAAVLLGDLFLWSLLFIVAVMDQKTGMIMDVFPLLIALCGIGFGLWEGRGILPILLGGAVGLACYGSLYLIARLLLKREGLGFGDVLLLGALGCFFPWQQVILLAFLSAYVSLIFIAVKAVREKKLGGKTEFPLGPSVCIAAFIMRCWGGELARLITGWILP